MMQASVPDLARRLVAEAIATALLLATIVGSGIMAERLSGGSMGLALLANALATGAMLPVLILVFGPISGAQMNPAVTAVLLLRREMQTGAALAHVCAQVGGGLMGVVLAHAMFDQPLWQASTTARTGTGQWIAEGVATAGLIFTILGTRREALPWAVGLYILAAYWFTASTSFANPAVTLARSFSDSFSGIQLGDVAPFIAVQFAAALAAAVLWRWLAGGR